MFTPAGSPSKGIGPVKTIESKGLFNCYFLKHNSLFLKIFFSSFPFSCKVIILIQIMLSNMLVIVT